jgi:hypothetical protein
MSVVQASLVGSLPRALYMKTLPPPFHSSRNDALPNVMAVVFVQLPFSRPMKSSPIDSASPMSCCQLFHP